MPETSNLIRADEAETLIRAAQTAGELMRDLTPTLVTELRNTGLLQPLLLGRVQALVLNQVETTKSEIAEETDDDCSSEQSDKAEYKDPRFMKLAKAWFNPQVERHFLERRDSLEKVSFKLLRTPKKGIALEAHQRLINQEEDWISISERWGMNPEKRFNGRYAPTPPEKLNPELVSELRRLKPGEISKPLRLQKLFAIAELEEWRKIELDEALRNDLAKELMEKWFENQVKNITTANS